MIKAGLPNITGYVDGNFDFGKADGCFKVGNAAATVHATTTGTGNHRFEFNASLYNSIYGKSTTVQPPALTVVYSIKFWCTAGNVLSAGLPNITSSVQFSPYDTKSARRPIIFNATDAMTLSDATVNAESIEKQATCMDKRYQLNFNASKSNPIYGNSTTVQPLSLTAIYAIKY